MYKKLITITSLLLSTVAFGQKTYYQMPNGKIINLKTYESVKENLSKNGKVEEIIISKIIRNDSVIIIPKLNVLSEKDSMGNYVDPYLEQKKLIGSHFPIELFENEQGIKFSKDFLIGKPTIINFWFTNCIPCVAEIPNLNQLKQSLKEKVNFFAITFDDDTTVQRFNQQHKLNYKQIVNAKEQLKFLKITAFPTNLILDKKGIVVEVYGDITDSEQKLLETLTNLAL